MDDDDELSITGDNLAELKDKKQISITKLPKA